MNKTFLIIGYGSMGKRRENIVRRLYPESNICLYDPIIFQDVQLIDRADAAFICSPFQYHEEHMLWCHQHHIPFLVEKPLGSNIESGFFDAQCAIGFNYRFHSQWVDIQNLGKETGVLNFHAYEQLFKKYGATVGGTSASHAIDMAVQCFGGPLDNGVSIVTDGIHFHGKIIHKHGTSYYDYYMDAAYKDVWIGNNSRVLTLQRDEECYYRETYAWIQSLFGHDKHPLIASIDDGRIVEMILEECIHA